MATIKNKAERNFRLQNNSDKNFSLEFNKIQVGNKLLSNDVTAILDFFTNKDIRMNKEKIQRAIKNREVLELRRISRYYFEKSGIYSRLCRYMASLYRYDWIITPIFYGVQGNLNKQKITSDWYKASLILENSNLKQLFNDIALKVLIEGAYYGYKIEQKNAVYLQELPVDYCRSRYEQNGKPAVELNLKYFDDAFKDYDYRIRVIKMFPKEIQKGYMDYKKGKLPRDYPSDDSGWLLLDPNYAVKFSLHGKGDIPFFVPVISALLDLEDAQDLDKKKMEQQLLKIIIQKMPIDKNGDLIFDVAEAQALHNNVVQMVGNAIGVDVLTTFADVDVADMADNGNVSSVDQLDRVERTVFNEGGSSRMLFNTDGNIALEKSIANDESAMYDLILQFEKYAESLLSGFNKNTKKIAYKVQILPTTVYNYKDLAKLYKEQTMLGFSKLLPQVALGQTQTSVVSTAIFENDILGLGDLFVPPQMSSTMSSNNNNSNNNEDINKAKVPSQNPGGRPELPDEEKSTKTIQNKESEG